MTCFNPDLADPVSPDQQALFESGSRVGRLARERFPGGRLVAESHLRHKQAERTTARTMKDEGIPALYEAAFTAEGIRIRVDVLERVGSDKFDLVEVKSTTRVKEEHLYDVGIQLHVTRGREIPIRRAGLLHLNKEYVYPGGDYELRELFAFKDLTRTVEDLLPSIEKQLEDMRAVLSDPDPPAIEVGPQCENPYRCPFYGHCHAGGSDHPVDELYRANADLLRRLRGRGIRDIREIPEDFEELSTIQGRMRDCVAGGRTEISRQLGRVLGKLPRPIHFLDFESFNPALPLYPGTRPYEVIPFQWSDHVLEPDGRVRHREYLHRGGTDPRSPFARSLLEATAGAASIVTYSRYESTRLRSLAEALVELAPDLEALRDRITDLLPLVRKHCYHPDFHGSFSLKAVLPAILPGFGYEDLEIQEGALASLAYAEMIDPGTAEARAAEIRNQLLAYCKRDTEAMLRLFGAFLE